MAVVTGYTASRMKQIEDESVVSGLVVGDNLVLKTRNGATITAGNVRGPADSNVVTLPATDFNNVTVSGPYFIPSVTVAASSSNSPVALPGFLRVVSSTDQTVVSQEYSVSGNTKSGYIYRRMRVSGVWGEWTEQVPNISRYLSQRLGSLATPITTETTDVDWNVGRGTQTVPYDATTKRFTIPVTGWWRIMSSVCFINPNAIMRVHSEILHYRGEPLDSRTASVGLFHRVSSTDRVTINTEALLDMDAGNTFRTTALTTGTGSTCTVYGISQFNVITMEYKGPS